MHPEMEPNYSKQRLIFRPKSLLLGWWGGMHPPHPPPPKSATVQSTIALFIEFFTHKKYDKYFCLQTSCVVGLAERLQLNIIKQTLRSNKINIFLNQ